MVLSLDEKDLPTVRSSAWAMGRRVSEKVRSGEPRSWTRTCLREVKSGWGGWVGGWIEKQVGGWRADLLFPVFSWAFRGARGVLAMKMDLGGCVGGWVSVW